MARKITVSFKETEKDLELFNYYNNMEDKSTEIKDRLRKNMIDEKMEKILKELGPKIDI